MRILVWTSRNIYADGGERTYMLAKQRALETLGCTVAYVSSSLRCNPTPEGDILLTVDARKLFALRNGYRSLRQVCSNWKPDVLVASGIWITPHWRTLSTIRKEFGIPISFDMHGALEEITEYDLAFGSPLASDLLFRLCRKAEAALLQDCADHIEVVSKNMEFYVRKTYPRFAGPITVVPCGIRAQFDDASYHRNRQRWRERFGLDPSRPAAVYSGSTAKWQRLADIVELARARPNVQFYLFLVGDASTYPTDLPVNVRIASLCHEDATEALCAFDFGFLLRRSDLTNFVAFPNKVGEYLNARLRIIVDSDNLGCLNPEFLGAFINATDVDFSNPTSEPSPLDLSSITWPRLAARLLRRYLEARAAMQNVGNIQHVHAFAGQTHGRTVADVQATRATP